MTAAAWVDQALVIEEEHRPLPDDPSPALLVARVTERLGRAAAADAPLDVAVALFGASSFALTAISRLDPEADELHRCRFKRDLVERLDREVGARKPGADRPLEAVFTLIGEACDRVVALEDAGEPDDRRELLEQACARLWELAVTAAAAAGELVPRGSG